jgi:Holliday junction resolvase
MAYQSASELTKMMLDYLKDNGNEVWRNNNLAVRGRAFIGRRGVPDIIGYNKKYGYFVAVEVKAIGDRASTNQLLFLEQLSMAGGCAMLCQQIRDETIKITIFKDGENEDWRFEKGELRK